MRRRQVYAEVERRKDEAQRSIIAGTLDQVSAFDPETYRVIVAATPSKPAPSLPAGPAAPVMRRRQLLPLQGDGPDGQGPPVVSAVAPLVASLREGGAGEPVHLTEPSAFAIHRQPGFCDKCSKHIGRGVAFHRARCKG